MWRLEKLQSIKRTLKKGNFCTSEYCRSRIFDIAARREERLMLIKLMRNIDALSGYDMTILRVLSKYLCAEPLVIGEKSSKGRINEDIVYTRHNVPIVVEKTFENFILNSIKPLIRASPGGLYVHINGKKLKKIRLKRALSFGVVARTLGVTRKAVQMYEQGMSTDINIALKLEKFLNESIIVGVYPFSMHRSDNDVAVDFEHIKITTAYGKFDLFSRILFENLNKKLGCEVLPTPSCPFDAVIRNKNKNNAIITCIAKRANLFIKKAALIQSISTVIERKCVLFSEEPGNENIRSIPVIALKELEKLASSDELAELISERSN